MPQIYDMGPTALLPLRRKACWEIFSPKNPTALAGFEPANLGTKGQHATPRPPKSYIYDTMLSKHANQERGKGKYLTRIHKLNYVVQILCVSKGSKSFWVSILY